MRFLVVASILAGVASLPDRSVFSQVLTSLLVAMSVFSFGLAIHCIVSDLLNGFKK